MTEMQVLAIIFQLGVLAIVVAYENSNGENSYVNLIEIDKPVWYPRFYVTGPILHFIWWRFGVSVFYWKDHSDD